jgi:hypothetical protein
MQNEVCHKTGQLYAKVAYRNTHKFRMLQRTVQVLLSLVITLPIGMMVTLTFMEITDRGVSSEHWWNYVDRGKPN